MPGAWTVSEVLFCCLSNTAKNCFRPPGPAATHPAKKDASTTIEITATRVHLLRRGATSELLRSASASSLIFAGSLKRV